MNLIPTATFEPNTNFTYAIIAPDNFGTIYTPCENKWFALSGNFNTGNFGLGTILVSSSNVMKAIKNAISEENASLYKINEPIRCNIMFSKQQLHGTKISTKKHYAPQTLRTLENSARKMF